MVAAHAASQWGRLCRSGGIQGGLSNGEHIVAKIAFKPTSTIARRQNTVSRAGEAVELVARGRHDPCVVPRAVPMVEAMAALVLADQLLQVPPPPPPPPVSQNMSVKYQTACFPG